MLMRTQSDFHAGGRIAVTVGIATSKLCLMYTCLSDPAPGLKTPAHAAANGACASQLVHSAAPHLADDVATVAGLDAYDCTVQRRGGVSARRQHRPRQARRQDTLRMCFC